MLPARPPLPLPRRPSPAPPLPPAPAFTAVLLAGGRSSRMGRDKALLPHPVSGLSLLANQGATLRAAGCSELLLSAPSDRAYPPVADRLVPDPAPDSGPLAGLVAGLAAATHPLVLVLAIDLPFVTPDFLLRLLAASTPACGIVPQTTPDASPAFFEPLCAVYPKSGHAPLAAALARRDLALQPLVTTAIAARWLRSLPVTAPDLPLLVNWNSPCDLPLPSPPSAHARP